jgi:hypothetical protein
MATLARAAGWPSEELAMPAPESPDEEVSSRRAPTVIACVALVAVGLLVLVAECWVLHRRRQAQAAEAANAEAAAHVEAARALLQRQEWDEAARLLEEALAVQHATATEEARQLLLQARRGQADVLLEGARAAAGAKDVPRALELLAAYLAHPQAADKESATRLEAAINLALSGPEAVRYLGGLSDEALARLARGGAPEAPVDVAVRDLFAETLRRHLPQEQARRAQLRAARARRQEQLRRSPAFRELARFVRAELRDRQAREELARKQARALALLPAQLKLTDPAELERLRAAGGREEQARVERKRAEARRAFRREPGHDAGDAETFDRLIDQELAALSRP